MSLNKDASTPEFWDVRIEQGVMPWDAGKVPRELEVFLQRDRTGQGGLGTVLIPGCGTAYEAVAFAEHGARVTAIDFSERAIAMAQSQVGDVNVQLMQGDFFTTEFTDQPFDLIYERAFLAALPKAMRLDYAQRLALLVKPGGLLIGYFAYGESRTGPPFLIAETEIQQLLGDNFTLIENAAAVDSLPVFKDCESWQVWQRRR